ncbi:aspartate aminotransferase family protein [Malaciobacter molluscorum LMG 25693]|uniref:Aspartate aminotransferase family protein n=1 Tax=Malaciobacter molluscorum LMG 25693 TaxID=870501 RepID=A0A2G1DH70_9BACT|nr:aspartate aminotransferase family protein [Malaciobacter molluscorum]AXX93375.1 N-succinyldiaminopimelate-aminotransferase / acetylornithine transaminase [Malaciobacter molluscorum LMG 25693]PHO17780.1 aspartate aminotransferase family protein [Malaciobacter molluscorum LMG 25693]
MSKELENLDKEYVLHTYARNYVNFKKGINATLFDENGKDYIDFTSGIGVVSVGHGNKQVADAIYDQISNITHISNIYAIEPQAKLAQRIAQLSGYDVATFFANSGAEANEGAIKIARKYGEKNFSKKRFKVITLEHSFHGRTITTVKATGQDKFHSTSFAPYPDGFSYNHTIDDIYNSIDDETVAVMIELVQGEGGVQPFPKKAIQELAKFLKEHKILLIVDEVQTGVFRTGEFLASNLYEIEPDIVTLAKGLAGGVPIGAILTKHKDIFSPGDHGSTFGGNYLSTRAGLEVVDILDNYKNSGKLDETIIYFEQKLKEIYEKYQNLFLESLGLGLMRGLRVKDEQTLASIIANGFDEGILVLKSGKNTLRLLPVLTISKEEIDEGFKRLYNALGKIS